MAHVTCAIWSKDVQKAKALALRLECGTAWVNTHSTIQPNAPFGGVKESGFGVEFARDGLTEYTSIQTVKIVKPKAYEYDSSRVMSGSRTVHPGY